MFVAICIFAADAAASGGLANVTIARAFEEAIKEFRLMVLIAVFQFASEDREIIRIYKRHAIPFAEHDMKVCGDRVRAVCGDIRVYNAVILRIGPKDKIVMPGGNLYHAVKIIRVNDIARDMPAEILISAAAADCLFNSREIAFAVLYQDHIIADTRVNYCVRIL